MSEAACDTPTLVMHSACSRHALGGKACDARVAVLPCCQVARPSLVLSFSHPHSLFHVQVHAASLSLCLPLSLSLPPSLPSSLTNSLGTEKEEEEGQTKAGKDGETGGSRGTWLAVAQS